DLGRYDGQGRITVLGRIMDRIKFAGVTLMPHQLEDTLREMKFAKEVCVVPISCDVTPTAAVILKKSWRKDEAKAAKLIHHLLRSEYPILSPLTGGIIFCESLPKSEDGRVLRHQLRRIQLPGLPAP
ncbi:AMP dependent CoA ligase, putative, partial [Ixodes scapularis]